MNELTLTKSSQGSESKVMERLKVMKFGQYKGKTLKSIYEKDPKYFNWIYYENRDRVKVNKELDKDMAQVREEAGCELYGKKGGLTYCRACKTMHNLKK